MVSEHQNMENAEANREAVRETLKQVIDPELGINIVDLGLVYDLAVQDGQIRVTMTLTTPGCPLGPYIKEQVFRSLWQAFPDTHSVKVELVWDPPWGPHRMSPSARQQMGWSA